MLYLLMYIHQLPQNILGLLVILITRSKYNKLYGYYQSTHYKNFGVSLGNYIIFGNGNISENSNRHEHGHQIQSKYLGWLYLIIIGIPSLCGNLWNRFFHRKWSRDERIKWYYNLPWEKSADKLGGVSR